MDGIYEFLAAFGYDIGLNLIGFRLEPALTWLDIENGLTTIGWGVSYKREFWLYLEFS